MKGRFTRILKNATNPDYCFNWLSDRLSTTKKMNTKVLFLISLMFILACSGENPNRDPEALKKEMESREIKRVKEGDILDEAKRVGTLVAELSQKKLSQNLEKAMKSGGPVEAVQFCNINAYSLLDSLREEYSVEIKRASLRVRNPDDAPNATEAMILDAYQYNIENQLPLADNLQKLGDTAILFSRPITISNSLCLSCHGEPGTEISEEVMGILKEKYPQDNATGHKPEDLRGMWSIIMSRKLLVNQL